MRNFIFGYKQDILIDIGVSEKELVLIDYLIKFFESGHALIRRFDEKWYFMICSSKIVEDLPLVVKSERRVREFMASLEKKGIIQKHYFDNQLFVSIDYNLIYNGEKRGGGNPPPFSEIAAEYSNQGGEKPPTIIKYIKNKIYIYYNINKKVPECEVDDIQEFFRQLKIELFSTMSEASYGVCISKAELTCLSPHLIVLNVKEAMPAVKKYHTQTIEKAVNKMLKKFKLIA